MVEEGSLGDVLNVGCKFEGVVQNDTEALDLGGEGYRESIDDDVVW